tara:strand:+ start:168 stop:608 length:441 start_codon:yes stop_codon:yes gene_type:complete
MIDNINFRSFKKGDYEVCCNWWEWWWKRGGRDPVGRAFLPKNERCFVIEKNGVAVACYFLFIMEPHIVGWTTYLVSNPEYKEKDRRELIKRLILSVEKEAEKIGIMQLFTICGNKQMSSIHESIDWMLIPVQNEGFKYLTNNFIKK